MSRSKSEENHQLEHRILLQLFQLIADLRNPEETKIFLEGVLTDVELNTLVKRIAILYCLQQGWSYDQIREALQVSSATIAGMQTKLANDPGAALALKKIQADEWANKWTGKILQWLGVRRYAGTPG